MVKSSEQFYLEFVSGDKDLKGLAAEKGIKTSTACNYVYRHYDATDADKIMSKLGLDKDTIARAYHVMSQSQIFKQQNPDVKTADLTPWIHQALTKQCTCRRLGASLIRRLYVDTSCMKKK